jgi:hypothetical protein
LVTDNGFEPNQATQFLLLSIDGIPPEGAGS